MKKHLHKLPLSVVAGLCLMGCGGNRAHGTDSECPTAIPNIEPSYTATDTVYVLNALPDTYQSVARLWGTNKGGVDFYGTFAMDNRVVFPAAGDLVVVEPNMKSPFYDMNVIKNITAEKRKAEYVNSK